MSLVACLIVGCGIKISGYLFVYMKHFVLLTPLKMSFLTDGTISLKNCPSMRLVRKLLTEITRCQNIHNSLTASIYWQSRDIASCTFSVQRTLTLLQIQALILYGLFYFNKHLNALTWTNKINSCILFVKAIWTKLYVCPYVFIILSVIFCLKATNGKMF